MCCAQSWFLYSPSSQNHMDISHLALLRGKGFYCLALLFEHDDVPNHGRLQYKARVHQPEIARKRNCFQTETTTSCVETDECLLMHLPYNQFV